MKNSYEVRGNVTAIFIDSPKYGRLETLISTSKLQIADSFPGSWFATFKPVMQTFYVMGQVSIGNGKRKTIFLHRLITNTPNGMVVDHHNHITLDNTDSNLIVCAHAENLQNRKGACQNNCSGTRGVTRCKITNKWRAQIGINKKSFYLGLFDTIEAAEKVVVNFRKTHMPFSNEVTA